MDHSSRPTGARLIVALPSPALHAVSQQLRAAIAPPHPLPQPSAQCPPTAHCCVSVSAPPPLHGIAVCALPPVSIRPGGELGAGKAVVLVVPMPPIGSASTASGAGAPATPSTSTRFLGRKKPTLSSTPPSASTSPSTSTTRPTRYPSDAPSSATASTTPPRSRPSRFRGLGGSPSAAQSSSTTPTTPTTRRRDGLASTTPADLPAATPPAPAPAPTSSSPSQHQHKPSPAAHTRAHAHRPGPSYTNFPPPTPVRPPALFHPERFTTESAAGPDAYEADDPHPHDHRFPAVPPHPPKDADPGRSKGHSRSSSSGALSDGLRNLNRWSASTTSSRASNFTNFTRRSAEVIAGAFGKSRHSASSDSPRPEPGPPPQSPSPPLAPIPPLEALPLVSSGPSLVDEVRVSRVLGPSLGQPPTGRPSNDRGPFGDGTLRKLEQEPTNSPPQEPHRADRPMPAVSAAVPAGMPYSQSREARSHSHSRSRSTGTNGVEQSSKARDRDRDRERHGRPPSQKAMLSKALQKANTAVQLDNAGNVEGARIAYSEACALLQQVLQRTSGEEDRNKLEAIVGSHCPVLLNLCRCSDL